MKGTEFVRKVRKLARTRKLPVRFVASRGKGSHGTLYYGDRLTRVKDRKKEIRIGLLRAMCKQLGIDPEDL